MKLLPLSIFIKKKSIPSNEKVSFRLKAPDGNIIEVYENSKDPNATLLGSGSFGHVTEARVKKRPYALKSQVVTPLNSEEQIIKEGRINEDLGIALTPSFSFKKRDTVEYYQLLNKYNETLKSRLIDSKKTLLISEKHKIAVDLILAIEKLHEGKSSKRGIRYAHGDIKPDNIMFDAKNNLRLIDFGLSQPLTTLEANRDKRSLLATIYKNHATKEQPSLFNSAEFLHYPLMIRQSLDWGKSKWSLKTIAALLIAYDLKPKITEPELIALTMDTPMQDFLIARHKRDKIIKNLSTEQATQFIISVQAKVERCYQSENKNKASMRELKLISTIIKNQGDDTPQDVIIKLDKKISTWHLQSDPTIPKKLGIGWLYEKLSSLFRTSYLKTIDNKINNLASHTGNYRHKMRLINNSKSVAANLLDDRQLPVNCL